MAVSEKSYQDRLGRSLLLAAAVDGAEPEFIPGDDSLSVENFKLFLTELGEACQTVSSLEVDHSVSAAERVLLVKTLRKTATQAVGYVKSNAAWATKFKAVKMAADKLRNIRPPRKAAPGEAGKRNKGEQAYAELQGHLSALLAALGACPGYNPPGAGISLATLEGLLEQFTALNTLLASVKGQLTSAREARRRLFYEGDDGLKRRFQAVKNGVKGQYGQDSKAYELVKSIRW